MCPECPSQRRRRVVARGFGRPSQAQAHALWHASGTAASSSSSPQSGTCQDESAQRSIWASETSLDEHPLEDWQRHLRVTTVRRPSQKESISNVPNAQVPVPATTWANGAALAKSPASLAIAEAVHNALGWQRVDGDDGPEQVYERGARFDPLASFGSYLVPFIHVFPFLVVRLVRPIRRSESLLCPGHDI
jgi:hypothetical protein